MKYLIFNTELQAQTRNNEIALSQGAGIDPNSVTKYWFATITKGEQCALIVDDISLLNDDEIAELKDEKWMADNLWF